MVAVKNFAFFVNNKATVSVTIVSNTNISSNFNNFCLQSFKMSRTTTIINIDTIRFVEDGNYFCTQTTEYFRGNFAISAIGAVHNYFQAVQFNISSFQNMVDVFFCQTIFINYSTNAGTSYCLAVINRSCNDVSNFIFYCVRQFMTGFGEEFNTIIFKRIVRSRDYYACISVNFRSQEGNCRGGHYT